MSTAEKFDKIITELAYLKGSQKVMHEDVKEIKKDVRINTEDLTEHKLGVRTNIKRIDEEVKSRTELIEKIDARLISLEFFPNFGKSLWRIFKWVGALAVSFYAIYRIFNIIIPYI